MTGVRPVTLVVLIGDLMWPVRCTSATGTISVSLCTLYLCWYNNTEISTQFKKSLIHTQYYEDQVTSVIHILITMTTTTNSFNDDDDVDRKSRRSLSTQWNSRVINVNDQSYVPGLIGEFGSPQTIHKPLPRYFWKSWLNNKAIVMVG